MNKTSNSTSTASSTASLHAEVAIVGTGVVGLTAAVCLAQLGVRVVLIGPRPVSHTPSSGSAFNPSRTQAAPKHSAQHPTFDTRVFALSHRSQRLLHSLRVWQAMPPERIAPVQAMHIWGDSHSQPQPPLRFAAHEAGVEHLSWIVEQHTLSQALCAAASFCPSLHWHPHALHNMGQAPQHPAAWPPQNHGHTTAQTPPSNSHPWLLHTAGGTVQAAVVLAADGSKSLVRQLQGLNFPTDSYSAQGLVANWHCAQPHHGVAHQWFDGDTVLALLPLPGPYVSMVWSMPVHRAQALLEAGAEAQTQALAQACHGVPAQVLGPLALCSPVQAHPLQHGMAPTWYQNGVALLGDAAHQMHPLAGQGLNIGLEDVAELADLLQSSSLQHGPNPNHTPSHTPGQTPTSSTGLPPSNAARALANPALWARWQRQRKAAFAPMHHLTHGLHGLFRTHLPGAAWLRNQGLALVGALPPLKRWLTQQAMR